MQIGKVVGRAISTVKHKSFQGVKLLLVQALDSKGQPDGEPVLTVDNLGAGPGMRVLISSDGKGARELVGSKDSPVRWLTIGVLDE